MGACRHGHDVFDPEPCEKCLLEMSNFRVTATVTRDGGLSPDLYPPSLRKLEPLTPHDRLVIGRLLDFHNSRVGGKHESVSCGTDARDTPVQLPRV